MAKELKQVYASLFVDENELQLVVSEYFNTRFNIIRVDKVKMEGIINFKITDFDRVSSIIKDAISYASKKIGATITKVILVIPAFKFKRYPLRVSVVPNGGILTKKDIAKAVTSSLKTKVDGNSIVVNSSIIKYTVNGISSFRLPEKEICDEALVDIDLLCADRDLVVDYVKVVTDAGVEVLDITLNNYAIAKESVLLDESLKQNFILLDIGNSYTFLTLLSKGKLVSTEIIYDGFNNIVNHVHDLLGIPNENASRLVKYNVDFNSNYPNDAVFAWGDDKDNHSITISELSEACKEPLNKYLTKILEMCEPIIESGLTSFVVVGEGAKMSVLIEELHKLSSCYVKAYYPEAIGVRDSSLCASYGAFYVYREKALLNDLNVSCVDIAEYDSLVDLKIVDNESESITNRIKKMFEQYRDKGVTK